MAPKLYGVLASPPVRAVLLCANELGLELEFITVDLVNNQEHLKEDFIKKNPQHTVPVLEEEDGFIVSDSHAIMAYLVGRYAKNDSLYPKEDCRQRATIDHKLYFDTGILFARGLAICKPLFFFGIKPSEDAFNNLKDALSILEKILEVNGSDYIAGDNLSIADFSILTSVTTWNNLVPYADYPRIKAYVERLEKLPYYKINAEGLELFRQLYESKL